MASRKDPSGYVWLAASIRSLIERLVQDSNRAVDLELPDIAAKLTDSALELGYVYKKLIDLASPAQAPEDPERLPF